MRHNLPRPRCTRALLLLLLTHAIVQCYLFLPTYPLHCARVGTNPSGQTDWGCSSRSSPLCSRARRRSAPTSPHGASRARARWTSATASSASIPRALDRASRGGWRRACRLVLTHASLDPRALSPVYLPTAAGPSLLGSYMKRMRGLPGNVQVAGDPEKAFEADAAANGVLLHEGVATSLKALAARLGVPTPAVFDSLDVGAAKANLYT